METDTALRVIYDYYMAEHCAHAYGSVAGGAQGCMGRTRGTGTDMCCLLPAWAAEFYGCAQQGFRVLTFYGFLEWTLERGAAVKDQHPDDDDDDYY